MDSAHVFPALMALTHHSVEVTTADGDEKPFVKYCFLNALKSTFFKLKQIQI